MVQYEYSDQARLVADKKFTSVSSVDFTGLNMVRDGYAYILVGDIVNLEAGDTNIKMFFNDVTDTTKYYTQQLIVDDTTITSSRVNDTIAFSVKGLWAARVHAIIILHHTGKSHVNAFCECNYAASSYNRYEKRVIYHNPASNITKITLTSTAGDMTGRIKIYKLG